MLIEDGKRLYLISEDPEIQKKMRELEKEEAVKLPLLEDKINESEITENIDEVAKTIADSYDYKNMKQIMKYYLDLKNKKGIIKNKEIEEIKKQIHRFLEEIENDNKKTLIYKYQYLFNQMMPFVKGTYAQICRQKCFKTFKDFLENSSSEELEDAWNEMMIFLKERSST